MEKVIVIAGGCGLLGKSFVKTVLDSGGTAVIADINPELGKAYAEDLKKDYPASQIYFSELNITSKESIQNMIGSVTSAYKKIDGIVNTAYPRNKNWGKKFEDVTYEDFCENTNLHMGGYFLISQQLGFFFKKQGFGNIINVASIQGVMAPKFDTYEGILFKGREMSSPIEYAAIKAAIIHMTKYMAKYFKGCNIRCNCISPGGILGGQPEEFLIRYQKYCTSKGMLSPEDLCGALLFLLSDQSQFVNGQNIIVDDGWSL